MTERSAGAGPHDLVAGYLLDALDDAEFAEFRAHLPGCPECRAELVALDGAVANLAGELEVLPPPAVEAALLASLFGDGEESAPAFALPETAGVPGLSKSDGEPSQPGRAMPAGAVGAAGAGDVVRLTQPSRLRRWVWSVAALAASFALGVVVTSSLRTPATPEAADQMHQILQISMAADAHVMPLDVPGSTTTLVVSNDMDKGAVMATSLPMPANGREYHLWTVMGDGSMQSAATFMPNAAGEASATVDQGVRDATAFMLTLELPGAEHPTAPPIAEATV